MLLLVLAAGLRLEAPATHLVRKDAEVPSPAELSPGVLSGHQAHHWASQPLPKFRQSLQNVQNAQYYGTLQIGGQNQNGIYDTGSFDLLVVSSRCSRCTRWGYNPNASHTYREPVDPEPKMFQYGSGPALAVEGTDEVSIGPYVLQQFPIYQIVDHGIDVLDISQLDAIVGIGPGPADRTVPSLVERMGLHRYSVCLSPEDGEPGYMIWEDDDPIGNPMFQEVAVTGVVHWGVRMTDVRVGGRVFACPHGCGVVLDSGTSLIAAPRQALAAMTQQMSALKSDCSNMQTMPVLSFTLAGKHFTLPPQAYIARMVGVIPPSLWDVLSFKPETKVVVQCVPLLMDLENVQTQEGPLWILGMPFFRYYYTTFSFAQRKVHVAKAGPDCTPAPFQAPSAVSFFTHMSEMPPLVVDPANVTVPRRLTF